jgi:proteasome lid subunit RPN8/RPN11
MPVKELGSLFQFASWRVPQFPRAIEYPLEVMQEIRAFACDELLQLSHGGNEVGGVLFGTRREDLVRILTWRPIACEHAHGERLLLSYNDRMNLAVQLELARQNADLKDLRPLGWFVSHLREGVSLSASDLEIYNGFFPEAWQVTLVIGPKGSGRAEAGFFVREADDKLQTEASYQCFELQPMQAAHRTAAVGAGVARPELEAGPLEQADAPQDRAASEPVAGAQLDRFTQPVPARSLQAAVQPALQRLLQRHVEPRKPALHTQEVPLPAFALPSFGTEERLPTKERWLWAIPIVLALGIAAFMLYQRRAPSANGIGLRASNEAQTVQLAWDANSRAIRDSYRGEINISDGSNVSKVSLTSDQLHAGRMSYVPQSSDVGIEMTVYPARGEPVHDSTRLIAPGFSAPTQPPQLLPATPPPASPPAANPPAPPPAEQGALEEQVRELKQEVGKERARSTELQNLVRILENRLGIQAPKSQPR